MYRLTAKYELQNFHFPLLWITVLSKDGESITGLRLYQSEPVVELKLSRRHDVCENAIEQIREWFSGKRKEFNLSVKPKSYENWLKTLRMIPYGKTISYAELAARHGSPRAYQPAGNACAENSIPIIIPCHRVLTTDGDLGNYGGFKTMKTNSPRNLALKLALIYHEKHYSLK